MRARQYVIDEGREEAGVVPPGGVLLLLMPWTQPRAEGYVVPWAFPTGRGSPAGTAHPQFNLRRQG